MSGPSAKITAHAIEAVEGIASRGKVSQRVVEVLAGYSITPFTPTTGSTTSLGAYGDECNTVTPDAAWTLRNIPSLTGDGSKYTATLDAQGDAVLRSFSDIRGNVAIMAHIVGLTDAGSMLSVLALDGSGNGKGFSRYNDGNSYVWNVSSYIYSSTGPGISGTPTLADHWLRLERDVSGLWTGRYSSDGSTWSNSTATVSDTRTITQIGIGRLFTTGGALSVSMERFVAPADLSGFSGGVAASQDCVEVLGSLTQSAVVSLDAVEILISGDGFVPSAGGQHVSITIG
jgi:hypothetical protein